MTNPSIENNAAKVNQIEEGQVIGYTVNGGRRYLTGYPVWTGSTVKIFRTLEHMEVYRSKMDRELPLDVEIRYDDELTSIDIGPAIYGIDYGRGSVKARFGGGYTPRGAYRYGG